MKILQAKQPQWADADQSGINLTVKFSHLAFEVDFHATPTDTEEHGRDLFRRAAMGEFGPVAPYVKPAPGPVASTVGAHDQMQPIFPTPATGAIPTVTFE
jgi:hypothetical protein